METVMPAQMEQDPKEKRANPLEILPIIMLVWIVGLVAIHIIWPGAFQAFGEWCIRVFWTIVPRHVRP